MSLADALFRAVLADPDDDAPRLIYADWLDENGDPERAEFIRVQCEQARTPRWERRWQELAWRGEALLSQNGARWRAALPALDGVRWAEFDRGFPSTVGIRDLATLYRHDDALAAAVPLTGAEVDEFNESDHPHSEKRLTWLRRLRFSVGTTAVRVQPRWSLLRVVRELELRFLDDPAPQSSILPPSGPVALTSLRVTGRRTLSANVFRQLRGASWAENLTRLELGTRYLDINADFIDNDNSSESTSLGPEGARVLARAYRVPRLEILNLDLQDIGTDGLAALLAARHLAGLRELSARACYIGDVSAFARSTGAPLQRLDLSDNQIATRGARALAEAQRLSEVKCLSIGHCGVCPIGLTALTASTQWRSLRRLDLTGNPLGVKGMRALARAKPPPHLHALRLRGCGLDADAVTVLTGVPWLRQLAALDLLDNVIGAAGAALLTRLRGGALRRLALDRTGPNGKELNAKAMTALVALLPQLVALDVRRSPLLDETPLFEALCGEEILRLQALRIHDCTFARPLAAVRRLVDAPAARRWVEFGLTYCPGVGNEAALLLANAPALVGLARLDLRIHALYSDATLIALARSPYLTNVTALQLGRDTFLHRSDPDAEHADDFRNLVSGCVAWPDEWGDDDP